MWERRLSGLSRLSFDVYEAEALEPFRRDAAAALTLNRRCRLSGSARMTEGPGLEGAGRRRPSPGGPGDLRRVVLPPVRVCGPSQEHSMRISVGHPARAGRRSRGDWRESCDELPTELRVKLELRDGPGPCRRRGLVTRRALKHPAACPPCRAAPMPARCRPPSARTLAAGRSTGRGAGLGRCRAAATACLPLHASLAVPALVGPGPPIVQGPAHWHHWHKSPLGEVGCVRRDYSPTIGDVLLVCCTSCYGSGT